MTGNEEKWIVRYRDKIIIIILFLTVISPYLFQENAPSIRFTSDIVMDEASYLRIVYIGSSGCGFSNNEKTHQMVRKLKNYFRSLAHNQDYRFLSTGISVDISSHDGITFLTKTGPYDQVIAGASWLNLGIFEYVWGNKFPAYASTPQILLLVTDYIPLSAAGGEITNITRESQLLLRASGMNEIEDLYNLVNNSDSNEVTKYLKL